jgi:hypothetical protein
MRVPRIKSEFRRTCIAHAPPGSPENRAVRRTIAQLIDEGRPLPGPADTVELRTPFGCTYARPVRGTVLVLLFAVEPPFVEILAVKPALW